MEEQPISKLSYSKLLVKNSHTLVKIASKAMDLLACVMFPQYPLTVLQRARIVIGVGKKSRCTFWRAPSDGCITPRQSTGYREHSRHNSSMRSQISLQQTLSESDILQGIHIRARSTDNSVANNIVSRAITKLDGCMTAYLQGSLQTDAAFNESSTIIMRLMVDSHLDLTDLMIHGLPARVTGPLEQRHNELRTILAELLISLNNPR